MKKLNVLLVSMLSVLAVAPNAMAADSEVKWTNPDEYRDIYPGEQGKKKFRERTFANLEKHIAKLANKLPEGQKLVLDVTDVDLAGDVHHGGIDRIRIIKDIHFPRMTFTYKLVDGSDSVVKSGEAKLRDMNFMMHTALKYRSDSLGYEKKMLDDWFSDTFVETVAKK